MKNKIASDILFNLGQEAAIKVFGAPYHYLSLNERLICKILAAVNYIAIVAHVISKR
jgi:hypothetical protein